MLDENSSLIVEIIGLNNQIKHGKGTTQLGEFTEKLDKKRKQLNKNLMTLAKWADESSDSSPRPPPQAQYAPQQQQMHHSQQQMHPHAHMQQAQQYAPRPGMPMNMGMHPHMAGVGGQMTSQSQMQQAQARYSQAQAHIQAQALAQYQARVAAQMGNHASQYMQMNPAMVQQQQQQQQPRYDPVMTGYGNPQQQQQQGMINPMGMAPPQSYGGYQMPNAYAMMPPQQQQQQVPSMRMNIPSPGPLNGQAQLSPGPSTGMQRPGN